MLVLRLTRTPFGLMQPDAADAAHRALSSGPLVPSTARCPLSTTVFGWSLDIDARATMAAFTSTRSPDLIVAGRDMQSLCRWLARFGWRQSRAHIGHFDILDGHRTVNARVQARYDRDLVLDNGDVQRALSRLSGLDLEVNGILDSRCDQAAAIVDRALGTGDNGSFSIAFRRALAVASAEIVEVGP